MLKDWELENGIVFGLDTYCGSTMEFQCMEGYELVGTPSVICQANGKWSATKPKCHRKFCFAKMILDENKYLYVCLS